MEPTHTKSQRAATPDDAGGSGALATGHEPDLSRLERRARAVLLEALLPGEQPRVLLRGEAGSVLLGTDSRALVFKKGVRAGLPFGHKIKAFEYESVIAVEVREADGDLGVVTVKAPLKMGACASYWADERDDPWKARNAIPVKRPFERLEARVATLRRLVERYQARYGRGMPDRRRFPDAPGSPETEPSTESPPPAGEHPSGEPQAAPTAGEPDSGPSVRADACSRCGAELSPGWRFCPACGESFAESRASARERIRQRRRS
jgi:hypothetical protein